MESRHLFADEQLVVAAPGYRGGNLPTTPQAIAASDIIFPWSPRNALVQPGGAEKADRPRGPAPERLQSGAGGGPPWGPAWRWSGAPSVAGAIARGELVQLTAVTVPYPPALLANRLPAGGEPAGSRPVHRPGWRRRSPSGASRSAFSLRPTAAGPSGRRAPGRDARNRARRDTDRGAGKTVRPPR